MNYTEAKQYLARHGQEHLLHFYDTLTPPQQESLLAQIAAALDGRRDLKPEFLRAL